MVFQDSDNFFYPIIGMVVFSAFVFLAIFIMRTMLPDVFAWNSPVSDLSHAVVIVSLLALVFFPVFAYKSKYSSEVTKIIVFAIISTTYLLTAFLALHLSVVTVLGFMGGALSLFAAETLIDRILPFLKPFVCCGLAVIAGFTFKSFIAPKQDLWHNIAFASFFLVLAFLVDNTVKFYTSKDVVYVTTAKYGGINISKFGLIETLGEPISHSN